MKNILKLLALVVFLASWSCACMATPAATSIGSGNGISSPLVMGTTTGSAAGTTILVIISDFTGNTPGTSAVTDQVGNTYTRIGLLGLNNSISTLGALAIYAAYNITSLPSSNMISYTYTTNSPEGVQINALVLSGVASSPLDAAVTVSAFGASTAVTATSGTPGTSGELFIATMSARLLTTMPTQASGWSTPPIFVVGTGTLNALYGGNLVNAGTSTETYAVTATGASHWAEYIFGFEPPGAASKPFLPLPMMIP